MCWLLFGVLSTPVLPHWHVKDPGHSAKSARGRLHLNTHTPWAQRSRSGLTRLLSTPSVGTYPETSSHAICQRTCGQSSQLAEPPWTEWNLCARANLHFETKQTEKRWREVNGQTFSQNLRKRGKRRHHDHHNSIFLSPSRGSLWLCILSWFNICIFFFLSKVCSSTGVRVIYKRFHRHSWLLSHFIDCNVDVHPNLAVDLSYLRDFI